MTHTTVSRRTVKAESTNYARIMLKTMPRDISMILSSKFNPEEFFFSTKFSLSNIYVPKFFFTRSLRASKFRGF